MRRGSVYQRHTRACPRDNAGRVLPHRCRGNWAYVLLVAPTPRGRRKQVTKAGFATKRQAQVALDEAVARERAGVAEIHGLTVGQYLDQWLTSKKSIRETTRRGYTTDIEKYLAPAVGKQRLSELRPHHIDLLYAGLMTDPNSPATPSTIRHVHTTLRASLNAAVKRRLIPWNPAQHVELPSYVRPETRVWTPEQLTCFLDATQDHRLFALFRVIAVTGLRRGEAIALHWADVDLNGGACRVRWQYVDAGGGARLGPPKTRTGARLVPLDPTTIAALTAHREQQRAEALAWESAYRVSDLVFTREDGSPLRPDYVSHLFVRLARKAEVPRIRLHDLRHTNASLALAAGVPLKVVSHRLGHSSLAITSDLYTHVIPAVAEDAARRIASLIDPVATTASPAQTAPEYSPGTAQDNSDKGEQGQ